jgi:hypothetical protein
MPSNRPATPGTRRGTAFRRHGALQLHRRQYSGGSGDGTFAFTGILGTRKDRSLSSLC